MIFAGRTYDDEYHPWFAWRPVRLYGPDEWKRCKVEDCEPRVVWLSWVHRMRCKPSQQMKYLAPFLVVFAILTDPSGKDIYVARDHVTAILHTLPSICTEDSHARLMTLSGPICVAEDPVDARRKLEEAK